MGRTVLRGRRRVVRDEGSSHHASSTPRSRGPRRVAIAVLAGHDFLRSRFRLYAISRPGRAGRDGLALGDTLILAGPGGQYGILTVAPSGAVLSVDGDPVDGYYPVTYDGVSGWTAIGLLQVADGGGGGNGGGGGGGDGNRGNHE